MGDANGHFMDLGIFCMEDAIANSYIIAATSAYIPL